MQKDKMSVAKEPKLKIKKSEKKNWVGRKKLWRRRGKKSKFSS